MSRSKNVFGAAIVVSILAGAFPTAAAENKSDSDAKKKVYQQRIGDAYVSAYFAVNRNLGRAWVEVTAAPDLVPPQTNVVARKMIKGLYYDPDRKAIVYERKGQETICATDWRFLFSTALKNTGNCDLQVGMKERKLDDGYTVDKEPVTTVTLVAHNFKPAPIAKASMGDIQMMVVTPDDN